jgi:hypothetical protein
MTPKELELIIDLIINPLPIPELIEYLEDKIRNNNDSEEVKLYKKILLSIN